MQKQSLHEMSEKCSQSTFKKLCSVHVCVLIYIHIYLRLIMKRNRGAANLPLRLVLFFKTLSGVKQKNKVRDGDGEYRGGEREGGRKI